MKSGLHFNPAPSQPTASGSRVSTDPLVAHFESYEEQWKTIASMNDTDPLTFATIPWPLLTTPRSPSDVTAPRVLEFMKHSKRGNSGGSSRGLKRLAMKELKNWHPDKFTTRVLARIWDEREREIVRSAADVVQKVLTELKSDE